MMHNGGGKYIKFDGGLRQRWICAACRAKMKERKDAMGQA
jgi:hypothetical protein